MYKLIILVFLAVFFFESCNNTTEDKIKFEVSERAEQKIKPIECDTFMTIKYNKIIIEDASHLNTIKTDFNFEDNLSPEHRAITTLNRKEFRFFRIGDTIITPEIVNKDLRAYSVFPPCYEAGRDIPKIIFVSNKYQCYGCYEYGKLVYFSAANTGKERTPTFPGRYSLSWKELVRKSSLDSTWIMPYTWNFHLQAGNAFHQYDMPGRPVSHSCVRQFRADAKWLYKWGEGIKRDSTGEVTKEGTTVIIIDVFDYARKKYGPWLELADNKSIYLELPDKPMEYEEALIPICQIPEDSRGSLKNRKRFEDAEQILRDRGVIRPQVNLIHTRNFNKERRLKEKERLKKLEIEQMEKDSSEASVN